MSSLNIPKQLPLLVVANEVLLPGASMRIPVSSARNMSLVRNHLLSRNSIASTIVGVVPIDSDTGSTRVPTLHPIGTVAVVVQIAGTNWPQPSYNLLLTGLCRFRLEGIVQKSPYYVGTVTQIDRLADEDTGNAGVDVSPELDQLVENFKGIVTRLLGMLDVTVPVFAKLKRILDSAPSHSLADICASVVKATYAEKLQVLDAIDVAERFRKTMPLLMRQIEGMQLLQKAKTDLIKPLTVSKRGIKDLSHEDDDDAYDDIAELENKIKMAKLPDYANKVALKELSRLKKMTPQMPEHATTRMYLELMSELPWSKSCDQTLDVNKARKDLDADHYGMDKVKKRVLEYLAVRQLRNSLKGPILCFVGPPGVGKTSIGRSVARTLGREFHRISLGGVCDQSDIRGHRRTYIGAMPGRIIQGLKTAAVNNPVFLLDEIDKLSSGIHGDPAAALLEVLDPEQNCNFTDHYLNLSFDLSQILFIATANTVSSIPGALLDRMEVIHLHGYTQEEKVQIASRHLMPKQLEEHGLSEDILRIPEESLKILIAKYTREAGVRSLERKISGVCRAVAVKVAEKKVHGKLDVAVEIDQQADKELPVLPVELPIIIDDIAIEDILGPPLYETEISARLSQPGVAVGLAWTTHGGEIMFVEAASVDGDGQLILTGQLGDVMKESAKLALNWVRNHMEKYDIKMDSSSGDLMENKDVHIHFPAGAVGKDGPSAGVTIVTVLVSLFSGRCVRSGIAMTGEITLRGLVLPVGGIKEKILAAHRAGIRTVILPKRNEKDLHDVPASVQKEMQFVFASHIDDVLQAAFEGEAFKPQKLMDISLVSKL